MAHPWGVDCDDVIVHVDGTPFLCQNKTGFELLEKYVVSIDMTTSTPSIQKVVDIPGPSSWNYRHPPGVPRGRNGGPFLAPVIVSCGCGYVGSEILVPWMLGLPVWAVPAWAFYAPYCIAFACGAVYYYKHAKPDTAQEIRKERWVRDMREKCGVAV